MRLFLAVDVQDAVRQRAVGVRARLLTGQDALDPRALRWVDAARLHLTLRFVGEVDEALAARIVGACTGALDLAPFDIAFGAPEWMPGASRPRVLVLPVTGGGAALGALKRTVDGRLPPDTPPEEDRPFTPHLTLARVRPQWQPLVRGAAMPADDASPAVVVCQVQAAVLYESRLSPRGPDYHQRGRLALAAAPPA